MPSISKPDWSLRSRLIAGYCVGIVNLMHSELSFAEAQFLELYALRSSRSSWVSLTLTVSADTVSICALSAKGLRINFTSSHSSVRSRNRFNARLLLRENWPETARKRNNIESGIANLGGLRGDNCLVRRIDSDYLLLLVAGFSRQANLSESRCRPGFSAADTG